MADRVGFGFDIHKFSDDTSRTLFLGGVKIPDAQALDGHSDADVICHAITDAILGAAGCGDMGEHFPDTDEKWKGADSIAMLQGALDVISKKNFEVINVDCTIVTEKPKIAPHRSKMQERLSQTLNAPVTVKAGRAEGLGAIGRVEGAACWAVALLKEMT